MHIICTYHWTNTDQSIVAQFQSGSHCPERIKLLHSYHVLVLFKCVHERMFVPLFFISLWYTFIVKYLCLWYMNIFLFAIHLKVVSCIYFVGIHWDQTSQDLSAAGARESPRAGSKLSSSTAAEELSLTVIQRIPDPTSRRMGRSMKIWRFNKLFS